MKKIIMMLVLVLVLTLAGCNDKKDLDYSDFDADHVDSYTAAETKNLSEYYIYYYNEDCSTCNSVKNDFLEFADGYNGLKIYFVNTSDVTDESTLMSISGDVPVIAHVKDSTLNESFIDIDAIKSLIDSLSNTGVPTDYDEVAHITDFADALNRPESEYILYYYSPSCGYCNLIKDFMLEYAHDNNVDVKVYFMNALEMSGSNPFSFTGTPAIAHIKNGATEYQTSGYITTQEYLLALEGADPLPSYGDFEHITSYNDIESQPESRYVVYYYSPSCGYCNQIKEFMFDFADGNDAGLKMYFLNAQGVTGDNTFDLTGTPSVILVENGVAHDKVSGANSVPEYLRGLE